MPIDLGDATIYENIRMALGIVYNTAFIWLPLATVIACFNMWVSYRRERYWAEMGTVILEVKLPKEIFKSPAAMEVILGAMHQTADEGNWWQKYWLGQTRSWFSLELVSIGGNIRFFIWMRKKYKNSIESSLYSQYPGIEVYEVEDYTKDVHFDPAKHNMFGMQWELSGPDPLPIKTYVDYGLDKDPDEEFKVDPMATSLEFLSTVTQGHNFWIQIIIRAHKKEKRKPGTWFEKTDAWKDEAKKQVDEIIEKLKTAKEGGFPRIPTKGEAEKIAAIERSVSKIGFDTTIRAIYFTNKDIFNGMYVAGMFGYFKQYASAEFNGFKSAGWYSEFGNPPRDWWKSKKYFPKRLLVEYKMRRFFFSPFRGRWFYSKPFVLNSEELATIYHFPGSIAGAPTFERIPSKKSQAPSNLPT
ncbi:MAG: hypothetical protein AAB861_02020, partial [Patescibacteria group bacterium]